MSIALDGDRMGLEADLDDGATQDETDHVRTAGPHGTLTCTSFEATGFEVTGRAP